jgi:hypothetical protein
VALYEDEKLAILVDKLAIMLANNLIPEKNSTKVEG